MTHTPAPSVPVLLFLPHYDFICGLLLNRPMTKWTLCDTPKHDSERDFKDARSQNREKHRRSFFSMMCRIRALEKIINYKTSNALQDLRANLGILTLDGISHTVHY